MLGVSDVTVVLGVAERRLCVFPITLAYGQNNHPDGQNNRSPSVDLP